MVGFSLAIVFYETVAMDLIIEYATIAILKLGFDSSVQ